MQEMNNNSPANYKLKTTEDRFIATVKLQALTGAGIGTDELVQMRNLCRAKE